MHLIATTVQCQKKKSQVSKTGEGVKVTCLYKGPLMLNECGNPGEQLKRSDVNDVVLRMILFINCEK